MIEFVLVDQFKVEVGGGIQFNNGWYVEWENYGVFDLVKGYGGLFDDGFYVVFIVVVCFSGFQVDKCYIGVLFLVVEVEVVNGKDVFNVGFFVMQVVISYCIQDFLCVFLGSIGWQLDYGQEDVLVFVGQKGCV